MSAAHWLAVADASVGESPRSANAAARNAASHARMMKSSHECPTYAVIVRTSGPFRSTRRSRCARSPVVSGMPRELIVAIGTAGESDSAKDHRGPRPTERLEQESRRQERRASRRDRNAAT